MQILTRVEGYLEYFESVFICVKSCHVTSTKNKRILGDLFPRTRVRDCEPGNSDLLKKAHKHITATLDHMTCDAGVVGNLKTKGLSGQLYCDVILVTSVDMRFILSSVALVLCVDVLHSLPHTYLQVT